MTQAMRQSTLETMGLGSVLEIFKSGKMPVTTPELVERVFGPQREGGLEAGDLLLAIELKARADGRPLLQPVASVTELRDWFNDRELGSYDGVAWRCWIARGDEVRAVEVTAKRLLW